MKGMLDFLEKAGLVKRDLTEDTAAPDHANDPSSIAAPVVDLPLAQGLSAPVPAPTPAPLPGVPINFEKIYADGGVAPSNYPAERLLRLMDGLSAMNDSTRLMAVQAMDDADESWSIEDPLIDAVAKAQALAMYSTKLQSNLQALQSQTHSRLDMIAARQGQVVGDIEKQISELEALKLREFKRAATDTATLQAQLSAATDQTTGELAEIERVRQRLIGLSGQFGSTPLLLKE